MTSPRTTTGPHEVHSPETCDKSGQNSKLRRTLENFAPFDSERIRIGETPFLEQAGIPGALARATEKHTEVQSSRKRLGRLMQLTASIERRESAGRAARPGFS